MKYVVILCDGMADLPCEALNGKTPMEAANKPNMDMLAEQSLVGMCKTVAEGLKPGSDVANLSVLGYDARTCYSGRSPLEAANLGIELKDSEVAMRCNLVTLSDEDNYEDKTMVDYCGGDITTAEAKELIGALNEAFADKNKHFYPGIQYRHCLVVDGGSLRLELTPPHDISDKVIAPYLSKVAAANELIDIMKKSYDILSNHPVNKARVAAGKKPANSAWFWGEGKRPNLEIFEEKFNVKGSVISAVDLIRGIGKLAGMSVVELDNVTGYIDTDFKGKALAAMKELENGSDFVFIHLEAPDECGHRGEVNNKVHAIELIDELVLAPVLKELEKYDDYKILIMPDHPTPLSIKTHTSSPVPFMIYQKSKKLDGIKFTEANAASTGLYIDKSMDLMPMFLNVE